MKEKTMREYLGNLFATVKRQSDNEEVLCFNFEYMKAGSPAYPIYEAVSKAQYDSGLTHDFSYKISSLAVAALCEVSDWNDEDALQRAIDDSLPIYTAEIMEIYAHNHWCVDEAREELGEGQDSEKDALAAWYLQTQNMVGSIKNNLAELSDEE